MCYTVRRNGGVLNGSGRSCIRHQLYYGLIMPLYLRTFSCKKTREGPWPPAQPNPMWLFFRTRTRNPKPRAYKSCSESSTHILHLSLCSFSSSWIPFKSLFFDLSPCCSSVLKYYLQGVIQLRTISYLAHIKRFSSKSEIINSPSLLQTVNVTLRHPVLKITEILVSETFHTLTF